MNYVKEFCERYDFPAEATAAFSDAYLRLQDNKEVWTYIRSKLTEYEQDYMFDAETVFNEFASVWEQKAGIHWFTISTVFLILLTPHLKELYDERGLSQALYDDSVTDIRTKAIEGHVTSGIWGTFCGTWTVQIFRMRTFRLGRLQFKMETFKRAMSGDGLSVEEGEPFIGVHIPAGSPLDHEECLKSYRWAAEFFASHFEGKRILFACESWLLSPDNPKILPPTSNILRFMEDYCLLNVPEEHNNVDAWRIFDIAHLPEDLSILPRKTSLQKAYAAWLEQGGAIRQGFGAFEYKG